MSVTAQPTTQTATTAQPTHAGRRRVPGWLIWAGILTAGVLLLAYLTASAPPPTTLAEPTSNRPEGAKAIATVLTEHGVQIDTVRSIDQLERADVAGATVLVSAMERMTPEVVRQTLADSGGATRIVLLGPTSDQLRAAALPVTRRVDYSEIPEAAHCTTPFLRTDERVGNWTTRYASSNPDWTACFPGERGAGVLIGPGPEGGAVVVVGSRTFLSNEKILNGDASALAVRVLGGTDRLIWYHSGAIDLAQADADSPSGFRLPDWFTPLVVLLASAVVLLGVIRGRRLGRVVTEPLPVVVRAIETTTARGLLYQRAADAGRSADILRDATRRRLGARFGLRQASDQAALTAAIAAAADAPAPHVHDVLWGPAPTTGAGLVDLANALQDLEEKVRQS